MHSFSAMIKLRLFCHRLTIFWAGKTKVNPDWADARPSCD